MTPHYSDDWLTLYGGDCREVLRELPSDSVDCVVTSPPYWGLRDYGTATWEGGDAECDHKGKPIPTAARFNERYFGRPSSDGNKQDDMRREVFRDTCGKCGATRIDSQLGLERTPEEYVANMVAVFREVRRVLKPSGTCWLNLGDSYGHGTDATRKRSMTSTKVSNAQHEAQGGRHGGMAKQLVGIPWRVAFALQADGWYLRSDIIWSKPNPMPESVTDRPTKSHEYLFLLTKSARYYFDADAVRESVSANNWHPNGTPKAGRHTGTIDRDYPGQPQLRNTSADRIDPAGRNIRSVWSIATRPYPGAHFAVFPPELPERCIKAGSSEKGVCPECGAPWERVVERARPLDALPRKATEPANAGTGLAPHSGYRGTPEVTTTGWRTTCGHQAVIDDCGCKTTGSHQEGCRLRPVEPVPAVILDPFAGSGTVGMVANRLSRRAILIDLNPEYLKQQMTRNSQVPLGLTEVDVA